jgi:prolyl oligopeptidase
MLNLIMPPPLSATDATIDTLHGVSVPDPFRWLEDQNSLRTRTWIEQQTKYTRGYLDNIQGRDRIRKRIREFLAIETYDSLQKDGSRYFYRKRLPDQEQPCIYMREGPEGEDQLLVDPTQRTTGPHTAVKPLRVSRDGQLLLYEIKEGGERTGTFACLDVPHRQTISDTLPRGYLRGFAFTPDNKGFYYVHESSSSKRPFYRAAYHHVLGTAFGEDREIFYAGEDEKLRLHMMSGGDRLGFLVYRFLERTRTDFFVTPLNSDQSPERVLADADYSFGPQMIPGKILALTDRDAPNLRIVEIRPTGNSEPEWIDIVAASDTRINGWRIVGDRVVVSRIRGTVTQISIFDFSGLKTGELPTHAHETVRLLGGSPEHGELLIETESFTEPTKIFRYTESSGTRTPWAKSAALLPSAGYKHTQVWYSSKDGTRIPMFLMGRREIFEGGMHPVIMTAYGGYGLSMTPQFSVFTAYLVERGCMFALPNIRGGSEFGAEWHKAAKRRKRQTAYDDFLCAADWLVQAGRTSPEQLAIFGGSNSGLLVGAALTQRPDLFRAVVCMVPLLDMLRYHLFDNAHVWQGEYGTADNPDDFAALLSYSPYHRVREGVEYPATMIVSGDADANCNPLHARKMTARLQSANASSQPIILHYSKFRGHSPVLPLSERIEALTDRMAFLCDQLQLSV